MREALIKLTLLSRRRRIRAQMKFAFRAAALPWPHPLPARIMRRIPPLGPNIILNYRPRAASVLSPRVCVSSIPSSFQGAENRKKTSYKAGYAENASDGFVLFFVFNQWGMLIMIGACVVVVWMRFSESRRHCLWYFLDGELSS